MQPKVQILIPCDHCKDKAYVPDPKDTGPVGRQHNQSNPCPVCQGSGHCTQWVSLEQFSAMLANSQCPHEHTSFLGGYHFTEGDVWDDIVEVCDDCGARLE